MNKNIISVNNLTKQYGQSTAVKNISFNVMQGDFFGFLGPNGAGKTTTVKMLTGLTSLSSGNIQIFDKDINKNAKFIKKKIGVVEDVSNLFPDLTVLENILFKSMIFGLPQKKIKKEILEYLEMFNLTDKLKVKFMKLSRGQKRIVSIISALLHSPDILFLDEPTLGLDINSRNKIHQLLEHLHKKEITIFLTSHYFEEVEKLCNRINVINHGNIIFDGDIHKLKSLFPGDKIISIEFANSIADKNLSDYFVHYKIKNNKLFITCDDVTGILAQIDKFVKAAQNTIVEINTEGNKLEDLFLRLVKQDEK